MDDDDWQHPDKCAILAESLEKGFGLAGSKSAFFLDLFTLRTRSYSSRKRLIFNSIGVRTDLARETRFSEGLRRASDAEWMKKLDKGDARITNLPRSDLFFWLCHKSNISNPTDRIKCKEEHAILKELLGEQNWTETNERLLELKAAITTARMVIRKREQKVGQEYFDQTLKGSLGTNQEKSHTGQPKNGHDTQELEPVSAFVKATILDGAFVAPMVPHMLRQAKYPLAETYLLVDPRKEFEGKYRSRAKAPMEFEHAVEQLLEQGTVERIVEVDYSTDMVRDVMSAFFGSAGNDIPTHAISGGPIYPTLYGIWIAKHDAIVQFDCDMLFYSDPGFSWVAEGLQIMKMDRSLAMMMAHPGPPDGPPGSSMCKFNHSHSRYDESTGIYKFNTATTRYFLTKKSTLFKKIAPIEHLGGKGKWGLVKPASHLFAPLRG